MEGVPRRGIGNGQAIGNVGALAADVVGAGGDETVNVRIGIPHNGFATVETDHL